MDPVARETERREAPRTTSGIRLGGRRSHLSCCLIATGRDGVAKALAGVLVAPRRSKPQADDHGPPLDRVLASRRSDEATVARGSDAHVDQELVTPARSALLRGSIHPQRCVDPRNQLIHQNKEVPLRQPLQSSHSYRCDPIQTVALHSIVPSLHLLNP